MTEDQVATPALIIDDAIVERNIRRLAEYAETHELDLRPHTKTHKSQTMAARQIAAGAIGLTVAKVGEAEVMAPVDSDILIAYPALDRQRTVRIATLAAHNTVRVAVDSKAAAAALSEAARQATIGILVDLDVGQGRTGVQSAAEALRLAQYVDVTPGLRLDGMCCYPGHIGQKPHDQEQALNKVGDLLAEVLDLWASHGIQARIVSGGSTPTAYQSHLVGEYTEIRPGTYIYNDMNVVRGGFGTLEDCAARILCTVISTAVPGQVVIDAGSKSLTSDRCGPAPDSGHGHIVEYPQARITKLSEEHGQVDVRDCDRPPLLGERVSVIPNHICPCVNLQDSIWLRGAGGELEPLLVDARGRTS